LTVEPWAGLEKNDNVSFIAITSSGRKRKISRAAAAGKKVEKSCFFCRGPDFSSSLREREREREAYFLFSLFFSFMRINECYLHSAMQPNQLAAKAAGG
jgi:hypothetical protein